ncbi:MAG: ABC transporter ATP-binding protein [Acidimicrobiales bacterium]
MSLLVISDLTVRYGRTAALRNVDLTVEEGEIVGLLGPNGAGKSTTLNAITGVVVPAGGTIDLAGSSLLHQAPERIVRSGVALVPEGRRIFGSLSVVENLELGATVRSPGGEVDADIEREMERFPVLRRYRDSQAGKLSGGEQQMLAISRALMSRPRLLLLDEPSLGLAPQAVSTVFDAIAALRTEGTTVLLVEQNAKRTVRLADRTYVLSNGSVVASGTREELADRDLAGLYLGEGGDT